MRFGSITDLKSSGEKRCMNQFSRPLAQWFVLAETVFLATYFMGKGEAGAYLAISEDGLTFRPLFSRPILKPAIGKDKLMRDPSLVRGPDGTWHMVWTTGWWDRSIGIAHSRDLVTWSEQKEIPVMEPFPSAINAWAPEIVYDASFKRFQIVWSSTLTDRYLETAHPGGDLSPSRQPLNHRLYFTTTRDFVTYEPTRLLWDPGFNIIDATLLRMNEDWLMIAKDETKAPEAKKHLFTAISKAAYGPFRMESAKVTGAYWAEGPTAVRLGGKTRVYFDRYMEGKWGAVESSDLRTWTDISDRIFFPKGARHGSVLSVRREWLPAVR